MTQTDFARSAPLATGQLAEDMRAVGTGHPDLAVIVSSLFTEPADYRTHGLDERIEIARLYDGREFLYRLVRQLAE
ncbi:hypothetical protein ACEQUB_p00701 (plasmid) [Ralstonia syzygii]|uniref:Uncharacterized protein n=1 Tax=Ralstonia syzygii R24 TaxID=907261 RepID=G3A8K6_9RALS|nr:hypothetical protein LMG10661_03201 [Ralstonia syzygii subsp. syzygii]CCA87580.1 conserved hypothetical protein [Ralstonia syzygii R24]